MTTTISAPTGFFSGNVAGSTTAEDLQTALNSAEAAVAAAQTLASATVTPISNPLTGSPTVTTITGTDYVGISQAGTDAKITLANLLNGETIDVAAAAVAASDTDTMWVGQGSNVMVRQTLSALWPWVSTKLSSYKRPVIELTANTTLDGSVHNMALLVVSSPITISPNFTTMGSGFQCDLVNLSGGNVTWAAGITTSGGSTTLATGNTARIFAANYSGGNLVFASTGQVTPTVSAPGQVTGLTAGTATANSQPLTWTAPGSGGTPTAYTVQYKLHTSGTWLTYTSSASGTSATVAGLTASSSYDYQVIATNSAGSGTASSTVTNSTLSGALAAPGTTTGLTAGTPTANTVPLTWTAPSTGGAVADYIVQYRLSGSGSWTTFSSTITATSTTVTGLSSSTAYDFQVAALNATGSGAYSSLVTATTAATSNYLLLSGSTCPSGGNQAVSVSSVSVVLNVDEASSTAEGSHSVPTNVQGGYSTSSTTPPTTWFNMSGGYWVSGSKNNWTLYANAPTPAGTYYVWFQSFNGSTVVYGPWCSGYTVTSS